MRRFSWIVIGGGSGGVRAARRLAEGGLSVALVEERALGGTCVNLGCVPKKLLVHAASYSEQSIVAATMGWEQRSQPLHKWSVLRERKDAYIASLNAIYSSLLQKAGVEIIRGRASIVAPDCVRVGQEEYTATNILLAVGSRPWKPSIPGSGVALVSDHMFHLESFPSTITIVGGGYIAVEFASICRGLGAEVNLLVRGDRLLSSFDAECARMLGNALRDRGVRINFGSEVSEVSRNPAGGCEVLLAGGKTISSQELLFATGRRANTESLGLERVGVSSDADGWIKVDANFRSSVPSIYAIGDCINRVQLTPVAIREAEALANAVLGGRELEFSYADIPTAVFCHPELATVGLTEEQACDSYSSEEIKVYRAEFRPLVYALGAKEGKVLLRLVVHKSSDRVLGAHMLGPNAAEIIQGLAIAISAKATKTMVDKTVGIHPTSAEEFVTLEA